MFPIISHAALERDPSNATYQSTFGPWVTSFRLRPSFNMNQSGQRASHHPQARHTHSQKNLLSMPNKAQHRPRPYRKISIRSAHTGDQAYLFGAHSRSGISSPRQGADHAEISVGEVGLLLCQLLFQVQRRCWVVLRTSVISVTNGPGANTLARIPCLTYSDDNVIVRWLRAALLAP